MARNRHPLLCAVGALAKLLYFDMHVGPMSEVWSSIDWFNPADWHNLHIFYGDHPASEMSYKNHAAQLLALFKQAAIVTSKLTHAMRGRGARDSALKG